MDLQPKNDPGSPLIFASSCHGNLVEMSISELVSVVRSGLDRVEEVLLARDAKLKAEIGPLQEKIEVERLMRLQAEDELKKMEKGKRAQESSDKLLNEAKRRELIYDNTIEELRIRNRELEHANLMLIEMKKKLLDDSNAAAELRIRVAELEDANKKHLETISKLRADNHKLEHFGNNKRKPVATLHRNKEIPHSLAASG